MWRRSNTKYGNVRQTVGGYSYHSKLEASYAMELTARQKAGEIKEWSRQHRFPLVVNGVNIGFYVCDFRIVEKNGVISYAETKGYWTMESVKKTKLFMALYPEVRYTVIGDTTPINKVYLWHQKQKKLGEN